MRINGDIVEISAFVPKKIVKNMDNPNFSQKEKLVFVKTTFIEQFHKCETSSSDMAVQACKPLDLNGVDMIITVCQTPDFPVPGISHLIQDYYKLTCGCLDINGACNGFIQGLATAYLYAQHCNKVLLVFSENMTSIQDEKSTNSLMFGDGAVALILNKYAWVNVIEMFSDGSRFKSVYQDVNLKMNGGEVYDFAMNEVKELIKNLYESYKVKHDFICLHQSNGFILKQIARELNISTEKIVMNIDRYGNTSGVSIPLALVTEKPTGSVLCVGYGAGLNWGYAEIYFNPKNIYYNEG